MAELETREQALAYLAQMSPTETFHVHPVSKGWVATKVLSPEQMATGQSVGLARLVIDSETGIIYQYPSWSETMVAEAYTTFKETGFNRGGTRIYPYQSRITIQRVREDAQTIVYQMTVESLTDPPEPTQQSQLTIEKATFAHEPRGWLASVATSHAEWLSRQNRGVWPEVATTEV
ncbi:hypothetical protein [Mycolicibacterium fluoranthenivorans]|uniref:Uncharacterized protein n=1 Tax=Mycolicibacterium fluoranthenivorans TaxID=258505 RepID=A0A1G4VVR3_9MYCO|nr:hypothetical protein [Mycolicibacterium fluoranthenivorans]SCX12673.1 hypothetical protein SAMN02799620_01792 [Mycolicibacterium fluoranthenivorans]